MFERIQRVTAIERYKRDHPELSDEEVLEAVEKEKFNGGIKLIPKDLRDYVAGEIAARVNDPAVVMKLLRHTSLETTTKYLRTVNDRLEAAVQSLGATLGAGLGGGLEAEIGYKTTQNHIDPNFGSDSKPLITVVMIGKKLVAVDGVEPSTPRI